MEEGNRSAIPITDSDLDALKDSAEKIITTINGTTDLEAIFDKLAPEETYRTLPIELELVYIVRHATCLYIWLGNWLFAKTGQKEDIQQGETFLDSVKAKQKFSSSYALFVMADYISMECEVLLRGKDKEKLATLHPSFKFDVGRSFGQDLRSMFSYYAAALTSDDGNGISLIKNANDIVAVSKDFWASVSAKALQEAKASPVDIQSVITNVTFKHNELIINGFEIEHHQKAKVSTFEKIEPEEIVGNHEAVIMLLRLCDRLALYDSTLKKNPMCEIGGLYESNLLDGHPGTGKTSLTKMAITRLVMRTEQIGLDCWWSCLDAKSLKSSWYGESAKQLAKILEDVLNQSRVALLIVDDIDLLLSPRDDPGSGGADRDLLKGLMDFFSGVSTSYIGNYSSIAATNKATGVDDALRQRFVYRVQVTGAETWEDMADLVALQLKRPLKMGLVKIGENGYIPLQRVRPNQVLSTKKVYNKCGSWSDIGHEIMALHTKNPQFTPRSVKNAIDVVMAKAGDFDIPEEYFSKPEVFCKQPYEKRVEMVKDLYGSVTTDIIMTALTDQAESEIRYKGEKYVNKEN